MREIERTPGSFHRAADADTWKRHERRLWPPAPKGTGATGVSLAKVSASCGRRPLRKLFIKINEAAQGPILISKQARKDQTGTNRSNYHHSGRDIGQCLIHLTIIQIKHRPEHCHPWDHNHRGRNGGCDTRKTRPFGSYCPQQPDEQSTHKGCKENGCSRVN